MTPHPEYEVVADTWEHSYNPAESRLSDRKRTRQQVLGERGTGGQYVGRPQTAAYVLRVLRIG